MTSNNALPATPASIQFDFPAISQFTGVGPDGFLVDVEGNVIDNPLSLPTGTVCYFVIYRMSGDSKINLQKTPVSQLKIKAVLKLQKLETSDSTSFLDFVVSVLKFAFSKSKSVKKSQACDWKILNKVQTNRGTKNKMATFNILCTDQNLEYTTGVI